MFDSFMVFISLFGNIFWILFGAALLMAKKTRKAGIYTLAAIATAGVAQYALKLLVSRPRPIVDPLDLLIEMPASYSFPSGHAMIAFSAAATIWFFMPKVGLAALSLALLIAVSRVYLQVHFVSDVFFGALFGIGISYAILQFKKREK